MRCQIWIGVVAALIASWSGTSRAAAQAGDEGTKVIVATPPTADHWVGWDDEATPPANGANPEPEKLVKLATPRGAKQTFSGKVEGLNAGDVADVGVISLIGVHWTKADNYEWSPVKADGTFEAVSEKNPKAMKALVVRADGHPWTFLRAEFAPEQSGKEIVIRVPPSKQVRLTVGAADVALLGSFKFEIFSPHVQHDDAGHDLHRQRYGSVQSRGGEITVDLPLEEVGLLVSAPGMASHYAVVNPAEADHFHFKLMREAKINGTITRGGKPLAGQRVMITHPGAPLSASAKTTDRDGRFTAAGRVPGKNIIYINNQETAVDCKEGETAEVTIEVPAQPSTSP